MTIHDKWLKLLMKGDKTAMTDFYLYLNNLRARNLDRLVGVDTIDEVKRLQGSIMTIDEIINFTTQEERENINQALYKEMNNGPNESFHN